MSDADDRLREALHAAADDWCPAASPQEAHAGFTVRRRRRQRRAMAGMGAAAAVVLVIGAFLVPLVSAGGAGSETTLATEGGRSGKQSSQPPASSRSDESSPSTVAPAPATKGGSRETGTSTPEPRGAPPANGSRARATPDGLTTTTSARPTTTRPPAQAPPASGVRGTVLFGPVCPVQQYPPDPDCADRPGPAHIRVFLLSGRLAAEGDAGSDGRFRIPVRPGRYRVEAAPTGPSIGRGCTVTPAEITVTAGSFTKVAVSCDTGIR